MPSVASVRGNHLSKEFGQASDIKTMQKHFADLKRSASIRRENAKHNSPELLSLGC